MRPDHSIGIRRNPFKRSASLRRATHRGCRCSFCGRRPRRPEAPEAVVVDCKTPPLWIDRNTKQRGSSEMPETKQQVQLLAKRFFWSQPWKSECCSQFPIYLPPLLCHLTKGSLKEEIYLPAILPQMPRFLGCVFASLIPNMGGLSSKQKNKGYFPKKDLFLSGVPKMGGSSFGFPPQKKRNRGGEPTQLHMESRTLRPSPGPWPLPRSPRTRSCEK